MHQNFRTNMLEVVVIERGALSWEWRVHSGSQIVVCGFATTRLAAGVAGHNALFMMLASGWNA
jgi:hypothetical protein